MESGCTDSPVTSSISAACMDLFVAMGVAIPSDSWVYYFSKCSHHNSSTFLEMDIVPFSLLSNK